MKRTGSFPPCAVVLALLLCRPSGAEPATGTRAVDLDARIRIDKIRLVIDERETVWSEAGIAELPENAGAADFRDEAGGDLKTGTVISFLSIRPGQLVLPEALEVRCRESEKRLMDSGYFYDASVMILPARKNPGERTVIVTVTSGYLWRYGGGNAFGMIGKEGLGGERASIRLYAGWNKNGAAYLHERVSGIPLVLGGHVFYFGPGSFDGKGKHTEGNRFEAGTTAGFFPHPDLLFAFDAVAEGFGPTGPGLFSIQPFVRYGKYLEAGTGSDAGFNLRGFMYPEPGAVKIETNAFFHASLGGRTVLAVSAGGGFSPAVLPEEAYFDLFYTDDRNVRSGYPVDGLSAPNYLLGTVELRQTVFDRTVPPAIDCKLHLFVFADEAFLAAGPVAAVVGEHGAPVHASFADAYGGGLRLLFDNPVFASFTFSYGINHEGKGRFILSGTAGF